MTDNNQTTSQIPNGGVRLTDFRSIKLQDLLSTEFESQEWLVDQLIPCGSIACLAGRPKVGKSYAVLELAISIASGEPLFGQFEVSQKNVLLISKEDGEATLKERLERLGANPNLNIVISTDQQIFFDDDSLVPKLLSLTRQYDSQVVIIDSFIRVFRGDENTSKGITVVHRVFKQLNEAGITVIFIHHHGKEDKSSGGDNLRGSSDIYAMIDSLLTVKRESKQVLKFANDANRHATAMSPFYVSFPDFNDDSSRFKFLGFEEGTNDQNALKPVDKAAEHLIEFLKDKEPMHQSEIIRSILEIENGYGATTIKNALAKLEVTQRVVVSTIGNRKLYTIPKIVSQTPIQPLSTDKVVVLTKSPTVDDLLKRIGKTAKQVGDEYNAASPNLHDNEFGRQPIYEEVVNKVEAQ